MFKRIIQSNPLFVNKIPHINVLVGVKCLQGVEFMNKQFAETLKNLRVKKGLTQNQLAAKLWLNKSIISAYENEQRMPSLDVLIKLSYEFNVSIEYLLGINKNSTVDVTGLSDEQISAVNTIIELFRNDKSTK